MKIKQPVSAIIFPNYDYEATIRERNVLSVYGSFICSRLKDDAGSYRNASAFVTGEREKELLLALCNEKRCDLEAIDTCCTECSAFACRWDEDETPSYTQYILDAEFDLLLDITTVFHFAYRREYKTMELFERLGQSTSQVETKALLADAVRRQRDSILRLDAKMSAAQFDAFFNVNNDHRSLCPVPAL